MHTQKLLHGVFLHRVAFNMQKSLVRVVVTHRTQRSLDTVKLVHAEALTQRNRYTKELLCPEACTQER